MKLTSRIKKTDLINALCVCSFFVLTIQFFIPTHLYLANFNNFNFYTSFIQLLFFNILLSSIFIVILMAILLFLSIKSLKIFKLFTVILFTASFLFWFFSSILVWDYGLFDGRQIDWAKFSYRGIIELIIYLGCIAFVIKKFDLVLKFSTKISLILILIQLLSCIFYFYKYTALNGANAGFCHSAYTLYDVRTVADANYVVDKKNQFNFSKKKNVIVVVLDSFQSDFFQEIINKNPEYKKEFDGFTYYRNAAGGYPNTAFTVPLILTSKYYDNSLPKNVFLKKSFQSQSSVPKVLKANNFMVDIYCVQAGKMYLDNEIASNFADEVTTQKRTIDFKRDVFFDLIQLYDVALFKISPHFFRKHIYNNRTWLLKRIFSLNNIDYVMYKLDLFHTSIARNFNIVKPVYKNKPPPLSAKNYPPLFSEKTMNNDYARFINNLYNGIRLDSDEFVFKYYHFMGTHYPIHFDRNLEYYYRPLPDNRESCISNAEGLLKLTGLLIKIFKEKKIFDNTMLFIIADTGMPNIDIKIEENSKLKNDIALEKIPARISAGIPLILVKPFNSRGDLKISDIPVSLANVGPTIFEQLDIKADKLYPSIFEIKKGQNIKRRFFTFGERMMNYAYFKSMNEFSINGFSWLESSWKFEKKYLGGKNN